MLLAQKISYYNTTKITCYMCIVWLKIMKIAFSQRITFLLIEQYLLKKNTIEFRQFFTECTLILPLSKTVSGQLFFSVILDFIWRILSNDGKFFFNCSRIGCFVSVHKENEYFRQNSFWNPMERLCFPDKNHHSRFLLLYYYSHQEI